MSGASLTSDDLAAFVDSLGSLDDAVDDSERIDQVRQLERLRNAVAAAQATVTTAFVTSQRAAQVAAGVPASRVGRGVAAQIGLARRISPFAAQRYVGWAKILTGELPGTYAALRSGEVNEWRAMIIARETAWLSRAHRACVDEELAPRLESLGDRRVESETKKLAYSLDPAGYVQRLRNVERERRVGLRPAPDLMARLSGLLPMAQGVAAYAALTREADTLRSAGDTRSRGQIMADTLVARVTGQSVAGDVPVEVQLVMTDTDLFEPPDTATPENAPAENAAADDNDDDSAVDIPADDAAVETSGDAAVEASGDAGVGTGGDAAVDTAGGTVSDVEPGVESEFLARLRNAVGSGGMLGGRAAVSPSGQASESSRPTRTTLPAFLTGYGPIPAGTARDLILARSDDAPTWLRRLYRAPQTGELVAMESRRRLFTAGQRRFIQTRDEHCRTPWCDAPIRHADHVVAAGAGGPTTIANGQGGCVACNHAKQAIGWRAEPLGTGPAPDIVTTTPTGHRYRSRAPVLLAPPHPITVDMAHPRAA